MYPTHEKDEAYSKAAGIRTRQN